MRAASQARRSPWLPLLFAFFIAALALLTVAHAADSTTEALSEDDARAAALRAEYDALPVEERVARQRLVRQTMDAEFEKYLKKQSETMAARAARREAAEKAAAAESESIEQRVASARRRLLQEDDVPEEQTSTNTDTGIDYSGAFALETALAEGNAASTLYGQAKSFDLLAFGATPCPSSPSRSPTSFPTRCRSWT